MCGCLLLSISTSQSRKSTSQCEDGNLKRSNTPENVAPKVNHNLIFFLNLPDLTETGLSLSRLEDEDLPQRHRSSDWSGNVTQNYMRPGTFRSSLVAKATLKPNQNKSVLKCYTAYSCECMKTRLSTSVIFTVPTPTSTCVMWETNNSSSNISISSPESTSADGGGS